MISLHGNYNGIIVQCTTSGFLPYILLFTQAPILVWFDGTIIDIIISTILLTMYYFIHWLCWVMIMVAVRMVINISVQYNGGFLPDIILSTQGYYHWGTRLNTM